MAIGGVADVRRLALNVPVMKVAATNGYKSLSRMRHPPVFRPVGAAEGCDLLILLFGFWVLGFGAYPLLRLGLLAVSLLQRLTFPDAGVPAQRKVSKRLCPRRTALR
jgi:hypothetical protein